MQIPPKLFPTVLIILQLLAAVFYLPAQDYRKMIYWIAAAVLTTVVTF